MTDTEAIRAAVMDEEPIIQINVPYVNHDEDSDDDAEVDEFEAQLPQSFADEQHAKSRASRRLPEDATFVEEPYTAGTVTEYKLEDF